MLRSIPLVVLLAATCFAQTTATCNLPPIQVRSAKGNFFTDAQENVLGDLIAERVQQQMAIVHDDALAQHMRDIGNRIVAQLPTTMKFQFDLIDLPWANAFSLPGGHIYISRKIIALARSDDEIAGLLAHEIGHIVTHQGAARIARTFHQMFNINSVASDEEIRQRFHQMLDQASRNHVKGEDPEDDQLAADDVAVEAMTRAGYNPEGFATLFGRLADTSGRSFFTDFFGTTAPTAARFRKMEKRVEVIPMACRAAHPSSESFQQWQERVIASVSHASAEASELPGLLWKRKLSPALRPDLTSIRYSNDGKYLLVQDSATIQVLTREPFAVLFRIPALNAHPAQFDPDGQTINFMTGTEDPRVESWSIANKNQISVHEIHSKHSCLQLAMSSDGQRLACAAFVVKGGTREYDVMLFDVATGQEVARSSNMVDPVASTRQDVFQEIHNFGDLQLLRMRFSPDAHTFIASQGVEIFAYDFARHATFTLPGAIKTAVASEFTFLAPDRILSRKLDGTAELRSFPDGALVKNLLSIGAGRLLATRDPNYAFVYYGKRRDFPLVLLDLRQNKFIVALKSASDAWNGEFASERKDGELSITPIGADHSTQQFPLGESLLGSLQTAEVSDDLKWLAFSDMTRGGVWNLDTGARVHQMRGFDGASLSADRLHIDMPRSDKTPHVIAHIGLNNSELTTSPLSDDTVFDQHGPVLFGMTFKSHSADTLEGTFDPRAHLQSLTALEARDVVSQKPLWNRKFSTPIDDLFAHSASDSVAFLTHDKTAKFSLEFLRLSTGAPLGTLSVDTNRGSFGLRDASIAGNYFLVSDTDRRVTVFNKSGDPIGKLFGTTAVSNGQIIALTTEPEQITLYDLATTKKIEVLRFPHRQVFYSFDAAGKKLFVLTSDQTAYAFDTDKWKAKITGAD